MNNKINSEEVKESIFEIKGAFIIENIATRQCVSKTHKLTRKPSQVLVFKTYIKALEYCLDRKFNKPNGYKIEMQNQLSLLINEID